jgi:hypothetical protein
MFPKNFTLMEVLRLPCTPGEARARVKYIINLQVLS